jgi:LysR family transcriptional regulator, hydrogen peroxide-inducible genes activator
MNISIPQLRSLVTVADTLHFGHAADLCGISQPALSAHISQLERTFNAPLIERTTRRVLLTPFGDEVTEQARRVLEQFDTLATLSNTQREPLSGPLHLGVIPTIAPYLLAPALANVRTQRPQLQLYLREEQTDRLIDELHRGQIDIALLALPVTGNGMRSLALGEEEFQLVVPLQHRLAKRKYVHEDDLDGEETLLLEDGHCFRDQALAVCARGGAHETSSIRATSISTLVQMTANGLGITLLPRSAVVHEVASAQDVVAIPFARPRPTRTIGLLWRTSSSRDEEFAALGDLLKSSLSPHLGY